MIDTVIVFGDSFNYGHGCKDRMLYYDQKTKQMVGNPFTGELPSEYCWASLLQNEYPNLIVKNFSVPGISNPEIFRNFFQYHVANTGNEKNTLIFFQMTNPDRIEMATHSDKKKITSYVLPMADRSIKNYFELNQDECDQMTEAVRNYIKWMYHPDIGVNQAYMTLLSAYGMATLSKFNFIWSIAPYAYTNANSYKFVTELGDLKKCQIMDVRTMDFSGNMNHDFNVSCRAPDNHVNEKGHEIYYNKIIKHTIQKFLS